MVGELFKVALDVTRRQAAGAAGEERVDGVPGQQGPVVARRHGGLVVVVLHHGGRTREHPLLGFQDADQVLGVLEVVQVGGVVLRTTGTSGNELCELSRELYLRGLRDVQEGNLVEHVGQPLRLLLPAEVESPQRVVERFLAHGDLRRQRLLREVHQRTANEEVLREVVLPVDAVHRLALHTVVGVRLKAGLHVGARVEDALVDDGHLACRVINGIV